MVSRGAQGAIIAGGIIIAAAALILVYSGYVKPIVREDVQFQKIGTCKGRADCVTGTIAKIVDGDTLDIDTTRIRLSLVNTPELNQDGYEEAKQFTLELCPVGSKAIADEDDGQTQGSYGRVIAKVTCGAKVLNEELLKSKMAEILTNFCDRSEFRDEGWARTYGCQ